MTNPSEPQSLESRVTRTEIDIQGLKESVSDLKSTVSTLADVVAANHEENQRNWERSQAQADADRALMLQLIQAIAQGRNGGQ